ncbi:FAD-dependent monooxygenase [Haladaptatus sp. DYF46]|uniref:FAD-dependent monooxygenase n=1 Tax=Haladaptatus sp. DYF46 TaxID=2886041 RepID=UPI001E2CBBEE|nr:FAD-dependent monooxygenase [Haladaptatus sp. DYF46]
MRTEFDLIIVGGGPTGAAAGVFTARYGFDTLVLDRGRSSLRRIAHLENYLGFPGGIDIETFYELAHAHAEQSGCEVVGDLAEAVERTEDGFRVRTDEGRVLHTKRVLAASKYDTGHLEGLDDDLFTTKHYNGEAYEILDQKVIGDDGRTNVDGLYVAGSLAKAGSQALTNAGHGATVGLTIIEDDRRDRGFPNELAAAYHDWVVVEGGYGGDDWEQNLHDQFDDALPEETNLSEREIDELRSEFVDEHRAWQITPGEKERRRVEGYRKLAARLDANLLLEQLDDDHVLQRARQIDAERNLRSK